MTTKDNATPASKAKQTSEPSDVESFSVSVHPRGAVIDVDGHARVFDVEQLLAFAGLLKARLAEVSR